jgi:formylglycine-generating enzyme required for sulfatase activity
MTEQLELRKLELELRRLQKEVEHKVDLEVAKLRVEAESKIKLEVRKLQLEVAEYERPLLRRKEGIAWVGSVLISAIALLSTATLGFYTTQEKIREESNKREVSILVTKLANDNPSIRENAGNQLVAISTKLAYSALLDAYDSSLEAALIDEKAAQRELVKRQGILEAIHDHLQEWNLDRSELSAFAIRAIRNEPAGAVRFLAIQILSELETSRSVQYDELRDLHSKEGKELPWIKPTEYGPVAHVPGKGYGALGGMGQPLQPMPAIDAFWIDVFPVSNRMWTKVMGTRSPFVERRGAASGSKGKYALALERLRLAEYFSDMPVVGVSYGDAVEYCAKIKRRLPTEYEWELAARGPSGWPFPWGHQREPAETLIREERAWDANNPTADALFHMQHYYGLGGHVQDISVYGVRALVTSVKQWTQTEGHRGRQERQTQEKSIKIGCTNQCILRGAARSEGLIHREPERFQATRRFPESKDAYTDINVGFRCATNVLK